VHGRALGRLQAPVERFGSLVLAAVRGTPGHKPVRRAA